MQKIILTTTSARHLSFNSEGLKIGKFPDGEVSIVLEKDVAGKEVVLVGSTPPPAENFLELFLSLDTIIRKGAKHVTCIIPYLGYSKSDLEKIPGKSISAQTLIKLLECAGGKKTTFVGIDLHSRLVKSFFSSPITNISLIEELAAKFHDQNDLFVAAPDEGAIERARQFAGFLGKKEIVSVDKKRLSDSTVKVLDVSGNVAGHAVVLVDDMVQSGGTIIEAAKALVEKGAKDIYVAVIHMDYAGGGWKRLSKESSIKKVITTNSINPPEDIPGNFEIIDITPSLQPIFSK